MAQILMIFNFLCNFIPNHINNVCEKYDSSFIFIFALKCVVLIDGFCMVECQADTGVLTPF
jgi:hypothetical protein